MLRIVSLIASATEIVHSLGLGAYQVGRSHECDFPEEVRALPVCTSPSFPVTGDSAEIDRQVKQRLANALSVYEVFENELELLQPTHIVTQTQCRVCAVTLDDVERALVGSISSRPKLIALEPNALDDIWKGIRDVASACGATSKGEELVSALRQRMAKISTLAAQSARRPRVACIEWHEPLMAAGNWVPELIDLANAENLFGRAGMHSPWMSWEELVAADPDVILSLPCGFDLKRTREEMYWLTDRPGWSELRAVRSGEVYLADGNQFMNRPGPRIVESLEILAEILHPDVFEPRWAGLGWEQFVTLESTHQDV
ncbi:MAG TPA: cobalamin-binding protein [Bryobacteraceae bacterium]|nr:cobalamin-binding protein [Bryobacteraceae bacterium]